MSRASLIWLLLAAGFLGLLANSIWTKHQINEILAKQLTADSKLPSLADSIWTKHQINAILATQLTADRKPGMEGRASSRIKIRIRGREQADGAVRRRPGRLAENRVPGSAQQQQQQDAQQLGTLGLAGQSVPVSWRDPGQSAEAFAAGVKLSNFRLQQQSSAAGNATPEVDPGSLAHGSKAAQGIEGRAGQPNAPGLGSNSHGAGSSPEDSSMPAQQSPQPDQARLAGVRGAVLDSARAPPVFPEIQEQPTDAMLAYAAAAAKPPPKGMTCEAWLAQADRCDYARDFEQLPVTVLSHTAEPDGASYTTCDVPCVITNTASNLTAETPAGFELAYDAHPWPRDGAPKHHGLSYYRHMESVTNYPDRSLDRMHASGVDIVMSTQLASEVPAGYLSWAEYDFMAPVKEKNADAAAFISNCNAQSFRLDALRQLSMTLGVHSYGACERNADTGGVSKEDTLPSYHFTLAFENSQEEDYVTEKYAHALVAGSVPVVIGATNMEDWAVAPNSMLVMESKEDILPTGFRMQQLLQNKTAYEEMLAWKSEGPQESFLALVDVNAVHSNCRLCVKLADFARAREEADMQQPPCKCARVGPGKPVVHHIKVRERSTFLYKDVFLEDRALTVADLHAAIAEAFTGHVPVWADQRPDFRAQRRLVGEGYSKGAGLGIYRVYQAGRSQHEALHGRADLDNDSKVRTAVQTNACLRLEVILI